MTQGQLEGHDGWRRRVLREVDNFTFKLHVVLNELSFLLFTFVQLLELSLFTLSSNLFTVCFLIYVSCIDIFAGFAYAMLWYARVCVCVGVFLCVTVCVSYFSCKFATIILSRSPRQPREYCEYSHAGCSNNIHVLVFVLLSVLVSVLVIVFVIVFVTLTILHTKQNEAIRVGSPAQRGPGRGARAELWLHYNYSLITHSQFRFNFYFT